MTKVQKTRTYYDKNWNKASVEILSRHHQEKCNHKWQVRAYDEVTQGWRRVCDKCGMTGR